LVIQHILVIRLQEARLFQDGAAHEHRRLADDAKARVSGQPPVSKGDALIVFPRASMVTALP
jgi:hypothetical protein